MKRTAKTSFLLPRIVAAALMLAGAIPLRAAPITVDGAGHHIGPLPLMIYDLARGGVILPNNQNPLYLFGLFDTGSTLVAIQSFDAGLLGIAPGNNTAANIASRTVEVRVNGLGAIDPGSLGAPIGSPFAAAQASVGNIVVGPRTNVPITLVGAPVANQVLALLDYTTPVSRGPYPFPVPDAGPTQTNNNIADGFAITFFTPGNAAIPTPEIQLSLERFGSTTPSLIDAASNGQRYLLRNVAFAEGAAVLDDDPSAPTPLNFFYDTGTTPTIISMGMANALGLSGTGTFGCLGLSGNGHVIDSVRMTGAGGTYTVNNASVCVDTSGDLINTFVGPNQEVDAVIGSNLFDQVPVLFDGPGNRLGIGISAVPAPATLLLLLGALPGLLIRRRRR